MDSETRVPILKFGTDPPTFMEQVLQPCGCGRCTYTNVSFYKESIQTTTGAILNLGCCSNETKSLVPRHKVLAYDIQSNQCCWCFPCFKSCCSITQLVLEEKTDREVAIAGSGDELVCVPKEHRYFIHGINAHDLNPQIGQYVYGPLSKAGDRLHMVSHLIHDGLADRMNLSLDLTNNEVTNESESMANPPIRSSLAHDTCFTRNATDFYDGHVNAEFSRLPNDTPFAFCLNGLYCMYKAGTCYLDPLCFCICVGDRCSDPCIMRESHTTIQRFNLINYQADESSQCCCCHRYITTFTSTENDMVETPLGCFVMPKQYEMRHSDPINHDVMQPYIFGDLAHMGDKAHGLAHMMNHGLSGKVAISDELNNLLNAEKRTPGGAQ